MSRDFCVSRYQRCAADGDYLRAVFNDKGRLAVTRGGERVRESWCRVSR